MAVQRRILLQDSLCLAFRSADERLVAPHRQEAQVGGGSRLSGPEHVAFLAQAQVGLGEFESVGRIRERLEASAPRVREVMPMHGDAQGGQGGAAHATAQLVELGEAELLGVEDDHEGRLGDVDADLDDETAAAIAAEREATRRASVYLPSRHAGRVTRDMGVCEAVSRDGDEESSPRTKDFVASLPASTSRSLSGWGKLFAEASAIEQEAQERAAAAPSPQVAAEPARRAADSAPQAASRTASEPAPTAARPQAPAAAAPAATEGVVKEEATTSTPPQGWRPVHVPAPTYTLAARAPRRSYADPVVDPGTSAPVPARPQSARGYIPAPVEDEEELFHPIDLDAILEGRRAAGE